MNGSAVSDHPAGLGDAGRRLWETITADGLILRPDERATLEQACAVADEVEGLRAIVDTSPRMIEGSRGPRQPRWPAMRVRA